MHLLINNSTLKAVETLAKELSTCSKVIRPNRIMQALHVLLFLEGSEDELTCGNYDKETMKKIIARGLKC